jgi:Fe-Mn family superoxide dismutase
MYKHQLPELPYSYDALEPFIDARTMEIHHSKHHAAYVNNLNAALEKHPELHGASAVELLQHVNSIPEEIREAVHNNAGGHVNHSFFWTLLGKDKGRAPVGKLAAAIDRAYGSFDELKRLFAKSAASRFGSGWAWLAVGEFNNLLILSTPNQHSPLINGLKPVIGLDVWEHAYYLQYQNRRADYVEAFWNVVDWGMAEEHYLKAI